MITVLSAEDVLHYRQQGLDHNRTVETFFLLSVDDAPDSYHLGWAPASHQPIEATASIMRQSAHDNPYAPGSLRQVVDLMAWRIDLGMTPHEAHTHLIRECVNYAIEHHASHVWSNAPSASLPFFQRNGMMPYGDAYRVEGVGKCYFVSRTLTLEGSLSYLHGLIQFDLDSIKRLLDGYYTNVQSTLEERYEPYQSDEQLQNVIYSFGKVIGKLETFNELLSLMMFQTKKIHDLDHLE